MYANWLSSPCIGFTSGFARAFCISNFALHSVGMTNQRQHMQKNATPSAIPTWSVYAQQRSEW